MASTKLEPARADTRLLSRWPFSDVSSLFRWPESFLGTLHEFPMRIEEFVDDGKMVVRAEIPGIDPDKDVEVFVQNGVLHIRAERKRESRIEEKGSFRSEMHYGEYSRSVALPEGASEKDVSAAYKDGILEVRVPVGKPAARARNIPVAHT